MKVWTRMVLFQRISVSCCLKWLELHHVIEAREISLTGHKENNCFFLKNPDLRLAQVELPKETTVGPLAHCLLWFRWRTNTKQVHTGLNPLCITIVNVYICWTRSVASARPLTLFDPKIAREAGGEWTGSSSQVIIILMITFLIIISYWWFI